MINQLSDAIKQEPTLPRLWDRWQGLSILGIFLIAYVAVSIIGAVMMLMMDISTFWLTAVTAIGSVIAGVGAILIVNTFVTKHSWQKLGFTPITKSWWILGALLAIIFGALRAFLLTWLSETFPALNVGIEMLEEMLVFEQTWEMIGITILTSTIIPFWEEFFFRGFIHNILRNKVGLWGGIILSSLVFGLFHFIPLQVLGAFTLGMVIAWAYEKSGSLWVAIYIHAFNNLVFVVLAQLGI